MISEYDFTRGFGMVFATRELVFTSSLVQRNAAFVPNRLAFASAELQ